MTLRRMPALLALGLLPAAAQANLLVNGSFEDGTFAPPSNQTVTLAPGATTMPGWVVINDSIAWIGTGNPWGLSAFAGDRFLDLSDYSAGAPFGGVAQTFATTPGTEYQVTFSLGSSTFWGRPASLVVSAPGLSQTFTSPTTGTNNDWQAEMLTFTAAATTTTLSFVGASGVNYIGLDDVSVTALAAVPEPSTTLLLLAGAGLLATRVRRSTTRASR
jgi:hypothetical protein